LRRYPNASRHKMDETMREHRNVPTKLVSLAAVRAENAAQFILDQSIGKSESPRPCDKDHTQQ
jgi:hypothetical protein